MDSPNNATCIPFVGWVRTGQGDIRDRLLLKQLVLLQLNRRGLDI